jgi:hypothetical protein
MGDELAAQLAEWGEDFEEELNGAVAEEDEPLKRSLSLLAAVEAVLKEHQPVDRGGGLKPICGTCHRGFWPCPTYQAIAAALAAQEAGDG